MTKSKKQQVSKSGTPPTRRLPETVSFYNRVPELYAIPARQRSRVINAALQVFLSPDTVKVKMLRPSAEEMVELSHDEALHLLRQRIGLD